MDEELILKKINELKKEPVPKTNSNRPSWDEYFMNIAKMVAQRSTCLRRHIGAVLVRNRQILSTGYNGPPRATPHCDEKGGCLRDKLKVPSGQRHELCRAAHAESNCISQAAANGVRTEDSIIYVTNFPCVFCSKVMINAGVKKIVFKEGYGSTEDFKLSKELLDEAGIDIQQLNV